VKLTIKEAILLNYLCDFSRETSQGPTIKDIMARFSWPMEATAVELLEALNDKRAIRLPADRDPVGLRISSSTWYWWASTSPRDQVKAGSTVKIEERLWESMTEALPKPKRTILVTPRGETPLPPEPLKEVEIRFVLRPMTQAELLSAYPKGIPAHIRRARELFEKARQTAAENRQRREDFTYGYRRVEAGVA